MQKLGCLGLTELEVGDLLILGYKISTLKAEASFHPSSTDGNQSYCIDDDNAIEQNIVSDTGLLLGCLFSPGGFLGFFSGFLGFFVVSFWGKLSNTTKLPPFPKVDHVS